MNSAYCVLYRVNTVFTLTFKTSGHMKNLINTKHSPILLPCIKPQGHVYAVIYKMYLSATPDIMDANCSLSSPKQQIILFCLISETQSPDLMNTTVKPTSIYPRFRSTGDQFPDPLQRIQTWIWPHRHKHQATICKTLPTASPVCWPRNTTLYLRILAERNSETPPDILHTLSGLTNYQRTFPAEVHLWRLYQCLVYKYMKVSKLPKRSGRIRKDRK